jgi:hypothetical protein
MMPFHIFSLWILPWLAVSRVAAGVPSPFPAALASTAFAVPYHALVLREPAAYSVAFHVAITLASEFDVSVRAISFSAAVFAAYLVFFDFVRIYARDIPRFHAETPTLRGRMRAMFRPSSGPAARTNRRHTFLGPPC